jgi:hypothetical protein
MCLLLNAHPFPFKSLDYFLFTAIRADPDTLITSLFRPDILDPDSRVLIKEALEPFVIRQPATPHIKNFNTLTTGFLGEKFFWDIL